MAQLCNKKTGPCFTTFDEDVATAFGIYCCISINHVRLLLLLPFCVCVCVGGGGGKGGGERILTALHKKGLSTCSSQLHFSVYLITDEACVH